MKTFQKLLFVCCCILPFYMSVAQSQLINYKAIIRDDAGAVLSNDLVIIQFSILQGTGQTNVYTENHTPTTDANGLIVLNIGEGTSLSGDYATIDWTADDHFLNVQINTGGGLVDLGTTQFLSVPYALHAQTAQNVTGLEALDEGNGIGWRLKGVDPDNYGPIGENAIDLSTNTSPSTDRGATGLRSFALGSSNTASGQTSFVIGAGNIASGQSSFATGGANTASGIASIVFGSTSQAIGNISFASGIGLHTDAYLSVAFGRGNIGGGNPTTWVATDPLFEIGNGAPVGNSDSNALTIYKNGNVSFGNNSVTEASPGFSFGFSNSSFGNTSFTAGINNVTSATASFALGTANNASGENSFAFGRLANASADYAFALGNDLRAPSENEFVIGSYNTFYTPNGSSSDRAFVIGNGTSVSRQNAVTVLKNGNTGIGTSNPQERLHIADGRLRIGSETVEDTGANRLEWNTSLFPDTDNAFQLGGSSLRWTSVWATDGTINTSDRREKKDIQFLKYGLREILNLTPVSFRWKATPEQGKKLGLIAQDVLEIIPEVVKTHEFVSINEEGTLQKKELDRLGVYYSDLIPVLIKAIQEQQKIIETQKGTLGVQEHLLKELAQRVSQLENKHIN